MSDQPTTIVGGVSALGQSVVRSLPAQFLVLVILNTGFIGGLLWFLDKQDSNRERIEERAMEARERVLMPLFQACLARAPLGKDP
jgi:hypothetical protein